MRPVKTEFLLPAPPADVWSALLSREFFVGLSRRMRCRPWAADAALDKPAAAGAPLAGKRIRVFDRRGREISSWELLEGEPPISLNVRSVVTGIDGSITMADFTLFSRERSTLVQLDLFYVMTNPALELLSRMLPLRWVQSRMFRAALRNALNLRRLPPAPSAVR